MSVVNIDNGFGAGQIADCINRPPARFREGAGSSAVSADDDSVALAAASAATAVN